MLLFCLVLLTSVIPLPASRNIAELPDCGNKNQKQGWILVNTLDGKLTALDYHNNGKEIWSVSTGPGPMLSSNIDRLELSNNGHWVRIIPSLTGSLYKFNGDTIDAIPITADSLLTSSFRYLDDLVIAGGKERRTYGVVLNSGELLYECSIDGCKNRTDHDNLDDLLLLERNTQTVRAIEPRSGLERWNFSVGQMNLKFPQLSCHANREDQNFKFNMKAVVPEGLIYAFGEQNDILWKRQFPAPIVNVWTWDGHNAKSVDLFSETQYSWSYTSSIAPALYVGMHNKQLYIHESVILQKYLTSSNRNDKNQLTETSSVSQIPWRPFPAKSSSLALVNIDNSKDSDDNESSNPKTTALSVLYASEYVNGNGFYLYTSEAIDKHNSIQCENNITLEDIEDESDEENDDDTPVQVIIVSLWYWWKEVAVIAITTAFAFNVIINKHLFAKIRLRTESNSSFVDETPTSSKEQPNIPIFIKRPSESSDKEFNSRYLNDFDPLLCLGKGGFGVVFEARNKIDECSYAVKRITLPNKPESRERVMREVRALAKLDHRNIVRYFNAWLESPPPEWIDDFDKVWNQDMLTEGLDFSSKTTKSPQKVDSSVVIDFSQTTASKIFSTADLDLKKPEINSSCSFIVFENSSGYQKSITASKDGESEETSTNSIIKYKDKKSKNSRSSALYAPGKVFLYIQMQLCQRKSLRDWLKDNLIRSNTEIVNIFEQIVSAVEYVHLKGLIHRDLKPSNIFFSMDGEVKIGDFGLVIFVEDCNSEKINVDKNPNELEKHTQAVGTQLYMSPEQLNGLKYNYKVDIYSLGVILFELLVPFHTAMERNKTLTELRKSRFPEKFKQDFQNEYHLLKLMLSDSPENRPTTYGIRARPPLSNSTVNCDYHFELPPRQ